MRALRTRSVWALALALTLVHWTSIAAAATASTSRRLKGNIFDHERSSKSYENGWFSWKSKKGLSSKAAKSPSLVPTSSMNSTASPSFRPTSIPTTSLPTPTLRQSTRAPTRPSKSSSKNLKSFKSSKGKKGSKSNRKNNILTSPPTTTLPANSTSGPAPAPASLQPTSSPYPPTSLPAKTAPSRTIAPSLSNASKSMKGSKGSKSGHSKAAKAKSKGKAKSKTAKAPVGNSPSRSPLLRPSPQPSSLVPVSTVPVTNSPNIPTARVPSPSTTSPTTLIPASTALPSSTVTSSITFSPSPGSSPIAQPPLGISTPGPSGAVPTANGPVTTSPPSAGSTAATGTPSTTVSTASPSASTSGNVSPVPASTSSPVSSLPPQPQQPSGPPVSGTVISATLFAVTYTVTSTTELTTNDYDAAANITLNHIEGCFRTYYQSSPTAAVVGIDGTSVGTANAPIRIGFAVDARFSSTSSPMPSTSEVDQVIEGCFVDPEEAILLSRLNGELPPANPFSTTSAAVYSTGSSTQATAMSARTMTPELSEIQEFHIVPVTPFDITFSSVHPHPQDVDAAQEATVLFIQSCLMEVYGVPVNVTKRLVNVYSSVVEPVRMKFAGTVAFSLQGNNGPTAKQVDTSILYCFKEPNLSRSFLSQLKQLTASNGFFTTTGVTYTPAPTIVVPITPSSSNANQSVDQKLSPAAISGIVLGVVLYVSLHVGVACYIYQKRQARRRLLPGESLPVPAWMTQLHRPFGLWRPRYPRDDQALLALPMPHHTTRQQEDNLMYFMDKDGLEQGYT